jgi:uncharacterized protein (TIGR03086 family)
VAALRRGLELVELAVGYALTSVSMVTPRVMAGPTPCRQWNARALLHHVTDSMTVLREALAVDCVSLCPAAYDPADEPVTSLRAEAVALLGACAVTTDDDPVVRLGDRELAASVIALTGAIELAAHGWDISVACGQVRPIPSVLTAVLLPIAPLLIRPEYRADLFAEPVRLPPSATPSDQFVAFLGRDPRLIWSAD